MKADGLAVTCLCPTYGRFQRLRDAVACFLRQDYPSKRLLVLNDAPAPIEAGADGVQVVNARGRLESLGAKRQRLLELAETPLVAHWDDDDIYLPWHLSALVEAYRAHGAACVKPGAAWYAKGPREIIEMRGVHHNTFEGQMLFERERALELGGYPPTDSGQAAALLARFREAGELYTWNPPDERVSYIYCWADGLGHISAIGNVGGGAADFARRNRDFGGPGISLVPDTNPHRWAARRLGAIFRNVQRRLRELRKADSSPVKRFPRPSQNISRFTGPVNDGST